MVNPQAYAEDRKPTVEEFHQAFSKKYYWEPHQLLGLLTGISGVKEAFLKQYMSIPEFQTSMLVVMFQIILAFTVRHRDVFETAPSITIRSMEKWEDIWDDYKDRRTGGPRPGLRTGEAMDLDLVEHRHEMYEDHLAGTLHLVIHRIETESLLPFQRNLEDMSPLWFHHIAKTSKASKKDKSPERESLALQKKSAYHRDQQRLASKIKTEDMKRQEIANSITNGDKVAQIRIRRKMSDTRDGDSEGSKEEDSAEVTDASEASPDREMTPRSSKPSSAETTPKDKKSPPKVVEIETISSTSTGAELKKTNSRQEEEIRQLKQQLEDQRRQFHQANKVGKPVQSPPRCEP